MCAKRDKVSYTGLFCVYLAWGNIFYSAGWPYLLHVARSALQCKGSILECGSGATTLVVAAVTAGRGLKMQVLENDPAWHKHMQRLLRWLNLSHVELVHAPLKAFSGFSWYGPPLAFRFENAIDLIVCDGPPSKTTRGGRFGLMPRVQDHLSDQCRILLDDSHRSAEQSVLRRWKKMITFQSERRVPGILSSSTEVVVGALRQ